MAGRSTPDRRALFHWTKVLAGDGSANAGSPQRAVTKVGSEPSASALVVFVDDDISVRESLELLIWFSGWQAETCSSAQEFLARPRVPGPSCLMLDVTLPDLNGLDVQEAS